MSSFEFYDEEDCIESVEETEPSFSFYDFKKWMDKQPGKKLEHVFSEDVKDKFKEKIKKKVEEKVQKKLKEKKKLRDKED